MNLHGKFSLPHFRVADRRRLRPTRLSNPYSPISGSPRHFPLNRHRRWWSHILLSLDGKKSCHVSIMLKVFKPTNHFRLQLVHNPLAIYQAVTKRNALPSTIAQESRIIRWPCQHCSRHIAAVKTPFLTRRNQRTDDTLLPARSFYSKCGHVRSEKGSNQIKSPIR